MSDNFQANQWQPDPRQQEFLKNYLDPNSETWSNALKSALKAGYAQEYSENILSLMPNWLSESIADTSMATKALNNLREAMEGLFDEQGKSQSLRLRATEVVAKAMMKNKFSDRTEHTGKEGKDLIPPSFTEEEKAQLLGLLHNEQ